MSSILSSISRVGIVTAGRMDFVWGSADNDIQTVGDFQASEGVLTVPAASSVYLYLRGASEVADMPLMQVWPDRAGCYIEILTDTAPSTNEQSVNLAIGPSAPFTLTGADSYTAASGGTAGQIRQVRVRNRGTEAVNLRWMRVDGVDA